MITNFKIFEGFLKKDTFYDAVCKVVKEYADSNITVEYFNDTGFGNNPKYTKDYDKLYLLDNKLYNITNEKNITLLMTQYLYKNKLSYNFSNNYDLAFHKNENISLNKLLILLKNYLNDYYDNLKDNFNEYILDTIPCFNKKKYTEFILYILKKDEKCYKWSYIFSQLIDYSLLTKEQINNIEAYMNANKFDLL